MYELGPVTHNSPKGTICMPDTKRVYETTFIVNASLDDHQIDNVIEKVKDSCDTFFGLFVPQLGCNCIQKVIEVDTSGVFLSV